MIWTILGIEETKDKKAIAAAYRARLRTVHPEEKPEEFMQLRSAYEEALRLADAEEIQSDDKTPVDLWTEKLADLYMDLQRRTDPDAWSRLLSDDICVGLDTRPQIEEAMIVYIMDHYRIPHEIWLYLDKEFSFLQKAEELKENYPAEFVDFVIVNGITREDSVPFSMFSPGKDGAAADEWFRLFYKANNMDPEEAAPVLEEMCALSESHPYGTALKLRYAVSAGDESAAAGLLELLEEYPDNIHLTLVCARALLDTEAFEKSEALSRRVIDMHKDESAAHIVLARALAGQEKYQEATDALGDAMYYSGADRKTVYELNELRRGWNEKLIGQFKEKELSDPTDILNFAWCYIENDDNENAYAQALRLPDREPNPFSYYNTLSIVTAATERNDEALVFTKALIDVIKEMRPDGTDKTERRIKRLPEALFRYGVLLKKMDRKEEADRYFAEGLSLSPDDPDYLTNLIEVRISQKNYPEIAKLTEHLTEVYPGGYLGFLYKALAYYQMRNDRIAFESVNKAIALDPSDLREYTLKLQILLRNGAIDEAKSLIEFLHENDIDDVPSVLYGKAVLIRIDEDAEPVEPIRQNKELAAYREIDRILRENKESFLWSGDMYYRMAVLTATINDRKKEYGREILFELLDRGLEADPDHADCLDYKAWLLRKEGDFDSSLTLYKKLVDMPHTGTYPENQLAEHYYSKLDDYADKAYELYDLLVNEKPDDPVLRFYAGMCAHRIGAVETAEQHFLREQELDPEDIDGYFRLAYVLLSDNTNTRLPEAVQNAVKTAEIAGKRGEGQDTTQFYYPLYLVSLRSNDCEAALRALSMMRKHNPGYAHVDTMFFDTYIRFGLFDRAKKYLDEWKARKKNLEAWADCLARWYCLQKNIGKALWTVSWQENRISPDTKSRVRAIYALSRRNTEPFVKRWRDKVNAHRKNGDRNFSHALTNYAFALWSAGKTEEAKDAARESLEMTAKDMKKFRTDKPITIGKRVLCLAILGRIAEAKQELDLMRANPMCADCRYSSCKDADVYEAAIELIFGNTDTAAALCRKGLENWPDEEDFIEMEYIALIKR